MTQTTSEPPSGLAQKKINRLIRNGIIVYAAAPAAIALVFILAGYGEVARPLLTIYYLFAILAGVFFAIVKIWQEIRRPD